MPRDEAPSVAPPKATRKTKTLDLLIPREDLAIFTTFAEHFGLSAEMVMENGVIEQLAALGDSTFSSLAFFDEFSPIVDPVNVTLSFIPEAHALMILAASLIRRPLEDLAVNLLRMDSRLERYKTFAGCVEARSLLVTPKYGGRVLDWGSSGARLTKERIIEFLKDFDLPRIASVTPDAHIQTLEEGKEYILFACEQ